MSHDSNRFRYYFAFFAFYIALWDIKSSVLAVINRQDNFNFDYHVSHDRSVCDVLLTVKS